MCFPAPARTETGIVKRERAFFIQLRENGLISEEYRYIRREPDGVLEHTIR